MYTNVAVTTNATAQVTSQSTWRGILTGERQNSTKIDFSWMTITGLLFLQCALKESVTYSFDFVKLIDTSNRRTDSGDNMQQPLMGETAMFTLEKRLVSLSSLRAILIAVLNYSDVVWSLVADYEISLLLSLEGHLVWVDLITSLFQYLKSSVSSLISYGKKHSEALRATSQQF